MNGYKRIQQLYKLESALQALIKNAEVFEGDCTILSEHLFKMQVGAKILAKLSDQGEIESGKLVEAYNLKKLAQASDHVFKNQSDAQASRLKAQARLEETPKQIEDAKRTQNEVQDKLAMMSKSQKTTFKIQKWESEISNLSNEQIIQRFEKSRETLYEQMHALEKTRQEFKKGNTTYEELSAKHKLLQDPLMRIALEESRDVKQQMLKKLYEFADLKTPIVASDVKKPEKNKEDASKEKSTDKPAPVENQTQKSEQGDADVKTERKKETHFELEKFQSLLSNHIRVIDERLKLETDMLNALYVLNQRLDEYASALKDMEKAAKQHHANAIELKKRIGLKQLNDDQVPDGITEALKKDRIKALGDEMAELLNHQTNIQRTIAVYKQPNEIARQKHAILEETFKLIGQKIDKLQQEKKLGNKSDEKQAEMTETDVKALEQNAIRLLSSDEAFFEKIIGLVPSERAKNLTSILQSYYQEIIQLEEKQKNLKMRMEEVNRLIKLANEELTVIAELPPLIKKQINQYKSEIEKELTIIKIRLDPAQADQLLANYETKTGTRLSIPAAIAQENKEDEIKKAVNQVFDLHLEKVAAQKWLDIFNRRLGVSGIRVEIGKYNDILGALTAKLNNAVRRMKQLEGHSHEDLAKLPPDEKPRTQIDQYRYLNGEIGVIRNDRFKANQRQAILVMIKLFSIILVALFLHWLTNRFIKRLIHRQTHLNGPNNNEKALQTVVVFSLLKSFVHFLIWSIAIIASLSNLGFEVGAILAGLGIGGFAVAMASKDTIANIIGGVNILITKSLKVGDYIIFKGKWSEVEDISIRYTRLREFATNFLITVPNAQLAETEVINTTAHPGLFMNKRIPLSIHNTVDQVNLAMQLVSEIFNNHPDATLKQVKLTNFEHYAFIIKVRYDVHDIKKWIRVSNQIHQQIIAKLQQNRIEFAHFPSFSSQTDAIDG